MNEQALDSSLMDHSQESMEQRIENIREFGYEVNISKYISNAASIFGKKGWSFVGIQFVFFLIIIPLAFLSMIPFVGSLIVQLVVACLWVGFYIAAQKISTEQPFSFSNFFGGFEYFKNISIKTLIIFAFMFGLLLIFMLVGAIVGSNLISLDNFSQDIAMMMQQSIGMFQIVIFGVLILVMCVYMIWLFADQFILFANMGAWEAMEASRKVISKKFFSIVLFMLALILLNIVGAMLVVIGLLVTMPISFIAIYCAWEDIMITQGKLN